MRRLRRSGELGRGVAWRNAPVATVLFGRYLQVSLFRMGVLVVAACARTLVRYALARTETARRDCRAR